MKISFFDAIYYDQKTESTKGPDSELQWMQFFRSYWNVSGKGYKVARIEKGEYWLEENQSAIKNKFFLPQAFVVLCKIIPIGIILFSLPRIIAAKDLTDRVSKFAITGCASLVIPSFFFLAQLYFEKYFVQRIFVSERKKNEEIVSLSNAILESSDSIYRVGYNLLENSKFYKTLYELSLKGNKNPEDFVAECMDKYATRQPINKKMIEAIQEANLNLMLFLKKTNFALKAWGEFSMQEDHILAILEHDNNLIAKIDVNLFSNQDFVGKLVKVNGLFLEYASIFKNNEKICLLACENNIEAAQFVDQSLLKKESFAIEIAKLTTGAGLQYLSDFQDDEEVVTASLNANLSNYRWASKRLKENDSLARKVFIENFTPEQVNHISEDLFKNNQSFRNDFLDKYGNIVCDNDGAIAKQLLNYISSPVAEIARKIISNYPNEKIIKNILNDWLQNNIFHLPLIQEIIQNKRLEPWILNLVTPSSEIALLIINNYHTDLAAQYLKEWIKNPSVILKSLSKQNLQVQKVRQFIAQFSLDDTTVLQIIKEYTGEAADLLKNWFTEMEKQGKINELLQQNSGNQEFLLSYLVLSPRRITEIEKIDASLLEDEKLVLELVKRKPAALKYLESYRGNIDFICKVIESLPKEKNLEEIGKNIKPVKDREDAKKIAVLHPDALEILPDFRKDEEIVDLCLNLYPTSYYHIDHTLRNEERTKKVFLGETKYSKKELCKIWVIPDELVEKEDFAKKMLENYPEEIIVYFHLVLHNTKISKWKEINYEWLEKQISKEKDLFEKLLKVENFFEDLPENLKKNEQLLKLKEEVEQKK